MLKSHSALAFKITDPFVGRLALPCLFRTFRCWFLCFEHAFRKQRKEFLVSKCTLTSKTQSSYIEAGDIGAAVGFKDIKTGDTLCDENTNYS
jgi:elongation factor G